jgi:hypothetical protein
MFVFLKLCFSLKKIGLLDKISSSNLVSIRNLLLKDFVFGGFQNNVRVFRNSSCRATA